MTARTNEQTTTHWHEAAQREANARDIVDALNDAELMIIALDDPNMRVQLQADFATSFWMQRYLPLAAEAGEEGKAMMISIVQEQEKRLQKTLNEFKFD